MIISIHQVLEVVPIPTFSFSSRHLTLNRIVLIAPINSDQTTLLTHQKCAWEVR